MVDIACHDNICLMLCCLCNVSKEAILEQDTSLMSYADADYFAPLSQSQTLLTAPPEPLLHSMLLICSLRRLCTDVVRQVARD